MAKRVAIDLDSLLTSTVGASLNVDGVGHAAKCPIREAVRSDARRTRQSRFTAYLASFYYAYENLFDLYEKGRVEPEKWENAFENALPLFTRPAIAQFGSRRVGSASERFGAYLRKRLPPAA